MTLLAAAARMSLRAAAAASCFVRPIVLGSRSPHTFLRSSPLICEQRLLFGSKPTPPASAAPRPPPAATSAAAAPFNPSLTLSSLSSQLTACLIAQDTVRADKLIHAYERHGGRCTLSTLNTWIGCFRKSADWRGAKRVWDKIYELGLTPDTVSYRNLIKVYIRQGSRELLARIEPLLADMKAAGLQFSATDLERFMCIAANRKLPEEVGRWADLARAAGVFDKMNEAARAIAPPPPDAAPPAAAPAPVVKMSNRALWQDLKSCILSGNIERAEKIIRDRGHKCDVLWMTAWIGSYARRGDWHGAERAWQQLLDRGFSPINVTYRHLIKVYLHNGTSSQLAKIDPLLAQMHAADVQFSKLDYKFLIETSYRCKQAKEQQRWTTLAEASGLFNRPANALQKLLSALPELPDLPPVVAPARPTIPASRLLPAIRSTAARSLLTELKEVCAPRGRFARAGELVRRFEEQGGTIDLFMANLWIASHQKKGNWTGAELVWQRIRELQLQPNTITCRNLIQVYMRDGSPEQLAKIDVILAEMQRAAFEFTAKDYDNLIKSAYRYGVQTEMKRWVQRAREAGIVDQLEESARSLVNQP